MSFAQSFRLAVKSLLTSKMRALLTMLGIIIGVAAVIVIVSLGNGMEQYMNDQFEKMGVNLIQVQVYGRGGSRSVEPDDMYALVDRYPQYLSDVSPYVSTRAAVRQGRDNYARTTIYGVSEAYYDYASGKSMGGEKLERGRFLRYIDVSRYQNVCVVGSYLDQEMFNGTSLGKSMTIGGVPYTVVGVLEEKADSTEGSGDDVIFIPYGNALHLSGLSDANLYLFTSADKDAAPAAKGVIEKRLYQTYQSSDYYFVMSSAEMMDAMNSMLDTLMVILIIIAAISLLVGGIGIMNIMLVSVTERTREIGIRKALGAKERVILAQFVVEAATTSALGGFLGIVLGYVVSMAANRILPMVASGVDVTVSPSFNSIAVAFGISVGIGVLFGYLPAKRAARLNPIEALRYD
mgnify:CR=1 FL=1